MCSILDICSLPQDVHDICIIMIPKLNSLNRLNGFRPITLYNVIYHIISKILANHLKWVLEGLVSESQSTFIPDRLIIDNVLLAFEVSHCMRRKTKGN